MDDAHLQACNIGMPFSCSSKYNLIWRLGVGLERSAELWDVGLERSAELWDVGLERSAELWVGVVTQAGKAGAAGASVAFHCCHAGGVLVDLHGCQACSVSTDPRSGEGVSGGNNSVLYSGSALLHGGAQSWPCFTLFTSGAILSV
ncbi:hypothetical protein ACOMHN_046124 [Nucella lapillus]